MVQSEIGGPVQKLDGSERDGEHIKTWRSTERNADGWREMVWGGGNRARESAERTQTDLFHLEI